MKACLYVCCEALATTMVRLAIALPEPVLVLIFLLHSLLWIIYSQSVLFSRMGCMVQFFLGNRGVECSNGCITNRVTQIAFLPTNTPIFHGSMASVQAQKLFTIQQTILLCMIHSQRKMLEVHPSLQIAPRATVRQVETQQIRCNKV